MPLDASPRTITSHRTPMGPVSMFGHSAMGLWDTDVPEIVLVHGYAASSSYMLPLLRALAPHARVHAPDLLGWGRSSKPYRALRLNFLADAFVAWMVHRSINRPALLGNSLGCQLVATVAVRHPLALSSAILLGPTVDPDARSIPAQAWRLLLDMPRERASLWPLELGDLLRMGPRGALRLLNVMMHDRIEDKLPRMNVPTLVLRGSRDPMCPQTWAERVVELLPHGELAVLPGVSHAANYSAPADVVNAVLPFLERLSFSP